MTTRNKIANTLLILGIIIAFCAAGMDDASLLSGEGRNIQALPMAVMGLTISGFGAWLKYLFENTRRKR